MLDVQAFVWSDAGSERFALLAQHDVALVRCEGGAGLCACSGCQLVRAVQLRANALEAQALVVLAHFVREGPALRLHNAEAVCWAGSGKGWPLSAHEHAALSRCVGARVAALAPMTHRSAADVYEAQGMDNEVGIGRHHGRCVGAGVGRAWASSSPCTQDFSDNDPRLDAGDNFEGGMSRIREHKTCFVVRSWCCLEFKCGGKSEHVHLPLHMTTQHPESEGRLVTQCRYNTGKRAWSAKVRKEHGSKLQVRRVLKLETADSAQHVQSAAGECSWARPPHRSAHTTWGSQWPREYAGMFSKKAAVGVGGWQRCTERVPATRAPGLSGVLSREQICAVVALLQPDAAVRVLEFFHSQSTPREDTDALCYSVLLGYTPCLAHVADAAVDLLLHSMRCATGGAAPHDCERRAERAHLLGALHASLLQGACTGALAPLNEWSHVARAGLVPAVLLHYGAVLTVRGPLPLVSQPGTCNHGLCVCRRCTFEPACICIRSSARTDSKKQQRTDTFSSTRARSPTASSMRSCARGGLPSSPPITCTTARRSRPTCAPTRSRSAATRGRRSGCCAMRWATRARAATITNESFCALPRRASSTRAPLTAHTPRSSTQWCMQRRGAARSSFCTQARQCTCRRACLWGASAAGVRQTRIRTRPRCISRRARFEILWQGQGIPCKFYALRVYKSVAVSDYQRVVQWYQEVLTFGSLLYHCDIFIQ